MSSASARVNQPVRFCEQGTGPLGGECASSDELLFVVIRGQLPDLCVTALKVVVTGETEDQASLQLLGSQQGVGGGLDVQLVFEGGEKAFRHGVIPAATLDRHAAADLAVLQQLPLAVARYWPPCSVWIRC